MVSLDDMSLFIGVADLGSFTAVAERNGLPKSSVSRRLRKLEDSLQARLLERTTRSLVLTQAGERFYRRSVKILQDVAKATEEISAEDAHISGQLRIYVPHEFNVQKLSPVLPLFTARYPNIRFNITSGTVGHHLLEDRIDIMVHIDEPADSSFIANKLMKVTTNYYASRDYIERLGEPTTPEQLYDHACIVEMRNQCKDVDVWSFEDDIQQRHIKIDPMHRVDSTKVCKAMVENGMGIAMLPDFICRDEVKQGSLVKLFAGRYEIIHQLYLVYPSRRHPPARVKVFLDFFREQMNNQLWT